jgi:hypothetical protein
MKQQVSIALKLSIAGVLLLILCSLIAAIGLHIMVLMDQEEGLRQRGEICERDLLATEEQLRFCHDDSWYRDELVDDLEQCDLELEHWQGQAGHWKSLAVELLGRKLLVKP